MILEVIATCVQDAILAEQSGADRIELITAITEGGLTPGIGMIEQVADTVSIPVNVMVRPHSRSFNYDTYDLDAIVAEIKAIASTRAAGIVFGSLTGEGRIDEHGLERVLAAAGRLDVTYHRAFDELSDQSAGLRTLMRYPQISRVLTSGGFPTGMDAAHVIRRLVKEASGSSLRILAGGGMAAEGIADFVRQTEVTEVHFGTAVRLGRSTLAPIDPAALRALADTLHEGAAN